MCNWYFISVIFFITSTSGYDYTRRDQADLADCIKDYLLIKGGMFHVSTDRVDIVRTVSDHLAQHFHGSVKTVGEVISEVQQRVEELKNLNYIAPTDTRWRILHDEARAALLYNCADERNSWSGIDSNTDSDDSESSVDYDDDDDDAEEVTSVIDDEPEDIAAILDFILARWIVPPKTMVRSRAGRSLLRKYVNEALERLRICLSNYDHEHFRILLRASWSRRAQRYYSGSAINSYPYNAYFLYIEPPLRRTSNIESYSLASWNFRNTLLPRRFLDRILNIHILAYPRNSTDDIYDIYDRHGMGKADYFFENQVDLFYRVVFFFLELRAAGVAIDEEDIYPGYIPHEILSASTSTIIASDLGYRIYLVRRRRELMSRINDTNIEIDENFWKSGRVWEENLVWLMINAPPTEETYSTTFNTTTPKSVSFMSTSTEVYSGKLKRDDSPKNNHAKCLKKRRRTFSDSCCEDGKEESSKHFVKSCFHECYNYSVSGYMDIVFKACSMLCTVQKEQIIESPFIEYYGYIHDSSGLN